MWCWKELLASPVKTDEMSLQFREKKPWKEHTSQLSNESTLVKAPRLAPSSGHWTTYNAFSLSSGLEEISGKSFLWITDNFNAYIQETSNHISKIHQLSPSGSGCQNGVCLQCPMKQCHDPVNFTYGTTSALVFQLLKDRIHRGSHLEAEEPRKNLCTSGSFSHHKL